MAVGKLYERNEKMMTINKIAKETGLSAKSVRRQIMEELREALRIAGEVLE